MPSSGNPSRTPPQLSPVSETDLVAVSDVFAEKAETIRQRYGAERAYTDYQEMIEKEKARHRLYRHASGATR